MKVESRDFASDSWMAIVCSFVVFLAGCRGEEDAKAEIQDPFNPMRHDESVVRKGATADRMVTAAIPIPPSFFSGSRSDGSRKTIAEILSEYTDVEFVPGAIAKFLPQQGLILVHHYPDAVEKFRQSLEGVGLHLPYDDAFQKYTRLVVMIRCLQLRWDESKQRIGNLNWSQLKSPGQLLKISSKDLDFELIDEDIQLDTDSSWSSEYGLLNFRSSGRFADPDFFSDSCFAHVIYPSPSDPSLKLDRKAHFVPGEEQLFYIGSSYVAGVTVYLISDFPIPTRAQWEGKNGTRLDDFDHANMAFSFEKGRNDQFLVERDVYDESKSWDFLYEPNRVGLGTFHPEVAIYANREPDGKETDVPVDPSARDLPPNRVDRGGICDLGDTPLDSATVPDDATFFPAIPKPRSNNTYAIRNRRGDLAGFIRILSVNFSKGDASSMRFNWRRVSGPY